MHMKSASRKGVERPALARKVARDAIMPARSNDGMDSSRDLNGIACQRRLASKVAWEGGAR